MRSEISQRKANPTWCHLYVESEKGQTHIETVKWWLAGTGGEGRREVSVKGHRLSVVRSAGCADLPTWS